MALRVYNTRTRTKEVFTPAQPKVVKIYSCGLTVYSAMHIGHARTYCFWDVFRRYLEYRGYHVLSVINYTDIDDRIIEQKRGCLNVAEDVIASFRQDCRALKIKDYSAYTRATDFVEEQIQAIKALLAKGHAYVVDGEVLYDVQSFPRYGQLSGNRLEATIENAAGRLGKEAERKRHPADFTLWKPSKAGEPSWPTGEKDWPQGRPGWHIECSVMSTCLLGEHFDVHGGAVDNLFPHHENEVAQSEPLCGHPWVQYWLHPEHLDLRNEEGQSVKMSKSLGNVIGIPQLLARYSADVVRWFYSTTHYRTKLAFNFSLVDAAAEGYKKIQRAIKILEDRLQAASDADLSIPVEGMYASLRSEEQQIPRERDSFLYGRFAKASDTLMDAFIAAVDDDMGTPQATAAIFAYVGELFSQGLEQEEDVPSLLAAYRCLARHLYVLGIEVVNARLYPQLVAECFPTTATHELEKQYQQVFDRLLEMRQKARKARDFAQADLIRDLLQQAGVMIEDTSKGPRWQLHKLS